MIKSSQSNNKLLPVVQSFPFSKIFVKIFLFHFDDTTCFWKKSMLIIFRPVQSWTDRSSPESISVQSIPLHMSRRGTGPYLNSSPRSTTCLLLAAFLTPAVGALAVRTIAHSTQAAAAVILHVSSFLNTCEKHVRAN